MQTAALARLEEDTAIRETLHRLTAPAAPEAPSVDDLLEKLAGVEARRVEASREYAEGPLDMAALQAILVSVDAQADGVRRNIEGVSLASPARALLTAPDLASGWDARSTDERRALLGLLLRKVVVFRSTSHGRNTFDADRIELVWQ